jgi:hypothetical protein
VFFKLIAILALLMLLHLRPIPFVQWLHNKPKLRYIASTPEKIYLKVLIMLTIEQIKKRLEDANLKRVAENAGVHPATVYRFMQDDSKPLYETVKALSDYLSDKEFANG